MLYHRVPLFDLLKSQNEPYEGFGEILLDSFENNNIIHGLISMAVDHIKDCFEIPLYDPHQTGMELEKAISEMWQEGWDPEEADVNLFVTDFGLLLTKILKELYGGTYILRSKSELNHLSIWWIEKRVEVFPFHKIYKRLINDSGENLYSFIQGLKHILKI